MNAEKFATRTDAVNSQNIPRAFLEHCDIFYAMRMLNHGHVLNVIAAFTKGEHCGFILPRAKGSLRTFCEIQNPSQIDPDQMILWLFRQLIGITDGLAQLHKHVYSRNISKSWHGALTPDNILWFPGDKRDSYTHLLGILIIGDADLMESYTDFGNPDTSLRYMALEAPSSYRDTCALGLICFEFVIWLILGTSEVQKFRSELETLIVDLFDHPGAQDALDQWSRLLMTKELCLPGTPIGELVQFIMCRLVRYGEAEETETRASATEFYTWVEQVCAVVDNSKLSYGAVHQRLQELTPRRTIVRDSLEW